MKVLAVILSLLIVVLSSFPCCQDDDLCPDSTSLAHTKEHCAHDDVPHDDDSHKNQSPCSPFYNCGRCSAFTISLSSIDLVAYEPEPEILPVPYTESFSKEFYFLDFKPPRIF